MSDMKSVEEVADAMYKMVKDAMGQKKFKSGDLVKASIAQFGDQGCDKKLAKKSL